MPTPLDVPPTSPQNALKLRTKNLARPAVTFSLYYWLLSHTTVVRTSLIAYTTPVVALAIGVLAMGEPITARVLAGSLLVVGGVALATA